VPKYANNSHFTLAALFLQWKTLDQRPDVRCSPLLEENVKPQTRGKQRKEKRPALQAARKQVNPTTVEEFFAMPERTQETLIGVANTVSKMRSDGDSLPKASRQFGVSRRDVMRWGRPALKKLKNGRYAAKAYDRLLRVVIVVSKREGLREVATRDSRQASKAAKHSAAVHRYLETGDASALARFNGKHVIDAKGKRVALLTDLEELDQLGSAGVLSFESLYARSL